jgi:hypothetical protein
VLMHVDVAVAVGRARYWCMWANSNIDTEFEIG